MHLDMKFRMWGMFLAGMGVMLMMIMLINPPEEPSILMGGGADQDERVMTGIGAGASASAGANASADGDSYGDVETDTKGEERGLVEKQKESVLNKLKEAVSGSRSCGDNAEFFSLSPVNLDDVTEIVPLGNLNPPSHTFPTHHMYWFIRLVNESDWQSGTVSAELRAPADMTIVGIASVGYENYAQDYSIKWEICDEVTGYFLHVGELRGRLAEAYTQPEECETYMAGGEKYKSCEKHMALDVKVGDVLGIAGAGRNALDFGMRDTRIDELPWANHLRWYEEQEHIVCSLDYFTPDIRDDLYAKLSDKSQGRKTLGLKRCGEVAQYVPGSVKGIWFRKGTESNYRFTYPEDFHIALVTDNIDMSRQAFSIGSGNQIQSGVYLFQPRSDSDVNVKFEEVRNDGVYCYETETRWDGKTGFAILLGVENNLSSLKLGMLDSADCGSGPWTLGQGYSEFER